MTDEYLIGDDVALDIEAAPPPDDADLATVAALAERLIALMAEAAEAEERLADVQKALRQVTEVDLPAAMAQLGITDFGLVGGGRVEVATAITASIPKERTSEAHAFLEACGSGGLIKRRIQILFGREDIAWAKKFLADCAKRKRALDMDVKEWVEHQTLGAWAREQLRLAAAVGADPEEAVPSAVFGIFKRTYASVTLPGQAPAKKGKKK